MRIYLSSTSQDLADHRRAVIHALQRAGHEPICMEHHAAGDVVPKDECLREVATCNVYVGIFAWRYGYIPPHDSASITELEYREAMRLGIPAHVFLLDEKAQWPAEFRDEGESGERIRKLRNNLQQTKWVGFFSSPDNLAAEVLASIARIALPKKQSGRAANPVPNPVPKRFIRHFQDRESELSLLRKCVADRSLRMALICGRGGTGKTSLMVKLLQDVVPEKYHNSEVSPANADIANIIYLPLGESGYRSADRVVELLSRTLDPDSAAELMDGWKRQDASLRERMVEVFHSPLARTRCLIVLDNLESLMDDDNRILPEYSSLETFIEACLEYDNEWLVLATSRRAPALSREVEILSIGRKIQIPLDEGLPGHYARDLLRELDHDGRLGILSATDDALDAFASRCQGIPRTLETVVATLLQRPTWTLGTLLEDEPACARLIEDPARELYASLGTDAEQQVMQALALFDKPAPLDAVRALLPELPTAEVRGILDRFVRNFIATYDEERRFWLHPLDRQYAYSRIPDKGNDLSKPVFHARAARYYHGLRKPSEHWKGIEDIEPQLDEFRHLIGAEQYDAACALLNEIDREYLSTRGYFQQIIKMRSQLEGHIEDRKLAGTNLGNLGSAFLGAGDVAAARKYYENALKIALETGDRFHECCWLGNTGLAFATLGLVDQAVDSFYEARDVARAIHDIRLEGRWIGNLTNVLLRAGRLRAVEAIDNYYLAIEIAKTTDVRRFSMVWHECLGRVYSEEGDLALAKEQLSAALENARAIGAKQDACRLLLIMGDISGRLGDAVSQAECYDQARTGLGDIQNPSHKANVLIRLAGVFAGLGRQQEQMECYDEALHLVQEFGDVGVERSLLMTIGDIRMQRAEWDKARLSYTRALENAREASDPENQINAVLRLANLATQQGDSGETSSLYERALEAARKTGNRTNEAIVLNAYANALFNMGMAGEAIPKFELTLEIVNEMNDTKSRSNVLNRLGMAAYFLHDLPRAIMYFEQELAAARQEADRDGESVALYNIGDAYHVLNDLEKAIPYYQDALALNMASTSFLCASGLGVISLRSGRGGEARSYFEQSLELVQANPMTSQFFHPYATTVGLALLALNRTQEGLDAYERALRLSPNRENLGYALQDLQMLQRAPQPIAGITDAMEKIEQVMKACSSNQQHRG